MAAAVVLAGLSYYLLCAGAVLGYIGAKLCAGKKAGVRGRIGSLIFPVRQYQLHLHHWFLALVTLTVCLIQGFYLVTPQLFYGSMCGLAIQGILCYDDWFHLVKKRIRPEAEPQQINALEYGLSAFSGAHSKRAVDSGSSPE